MAAPAYLTRWRVLAVGLLVQSVGGLFYAFSLYSSQLKTRFSLTQEQLGLIGSGAIVGGNVGTHVGMLYDRKGPRAVLFLSACLALAGWLPMWYALNQPDGGWVPPYGALVLFAVFQGHAQMSSDTAVVGTAVALFPSHRGLAIGLCKSFVGLSGALAAQWYAGVFDCPKTDGHGPSGKNASLALDLGWGPGPDSSEPEDTAPWAYMYSARGNIYGDLQVGNSTPSTGDDCTGYIPFLLFIVIEICGICGIGMLFLQRLPVVVAPFAETKQQLQQVVYFVVFLALLTAGASVVEKKGHTGYSGLLGLMLAVQFSFAGLLSFTASKSDQTSSALSSKHIYEDDEDDGGKGITPLLGAGKGSVNAGEVDDDGGAEAVLESLSLVQAMQRPELYLIFVMFFIGGGSGTLVIENLAQIVDSATETKGSDHTVYVTLISVCNCLGRLLSGVIGDVMLAHGYGRPLVFAGAMAMMVVAQVVLMFGIPSLLYIACILTGLAYGAFNSLCPVLISEIFGLKHFGSIYATNSIANGAANLVMATLMAGTLYHEHAHKEDGAWTCKGPKCFMSSHIICAVLCGVGTLIALNLTVLTRPRYRVIHQDVLRKSM